MSASPSYAPNDTTSMLIGEQSTIVENQMECIFYGMELMLYLFTAHSMYRTGLKKHATLFTLITIQLILVTLGVAGNSQFLVLSFVYNRNYPGGIQEYRNAYSKVPISYIGLVGPILSTWIQDLLLLYRFYVIWAGYFWLLVIPALIFLTSLAFQIILLVEVAAKAGEINVAANIHVSLISFSLSVGLNVFVTALIVARIYQYKQQIGSSLGAEHAKIYTSIATMFVESAALVTISGLAFIITVATSPPGSNIVSGIYGVTTAMAPTLIAYRVSTGSAWTRETCKTNPSTIQFADRRSFGDPCKTTTTTPASAVISRGFTNATTDVESVTSEKALDSPTDPHGSRPDLNKYV